MTGRGAEHGDVLRAGVFLDRDGTVIVDRHYLGEPGGVELLPGAAEAIARLNRAGLPVLLVTNQSGIARGYFSESDFHAVQARLERLLAGFGAHLDGVYFCPHGPDTEPPCACRKPGTELFTRAAADHRLDLSRSVFIGDRARDVEPALVFGGTGYLVRTPGSREGSPADRGCKGAQVTEVLSLAEAVEGVLGAAELD